MILKHKTGSAKLADFLALYRELDNLVLIDFSHRNILESWNANSTVGEEERKKQVEIWENEVASSSAAVSDKKAEIANMYLNGYDLLGLPDGAKAPLVEQAFATKYRQARTNEVRCRLTSSYFKDSEDAQSRLQYLKLVNEKAFYEDMMKRLQKAKSEVGPTQFS